MKKHLYNTFFSLPKASLILFLISPCLAIAQINYDSTFNRNARFLYDEAGTNETFITTLTQQDGKVLIVGETDYDPDEANNYRILVIRLNDDGTYDHSFGQQGKVYIDTPDATDRANGATLQTDGKILIVGYQGLFKGTVYRLNINGSLDPTFGTGGKAVINPESVYEFRSIKIQSDGKIVVAGYGFINSRFSYLIARFLNSGALDPSFNSQGYHKFRTSTSNLEEDSGAGYGLDIHNNKIISCGYNERAKEEGTVVRLNTDGTLDNTFGNSGTMQLILGQDLFLYDVVVNNDGKIILGGRYESSSSLHRAILIRLFPNGNMDAAFGEGGYRLYGSGFGAGKIFMYQNERILIGGGSYLAMVNSSGSLLQELSIDIGNNVFFTYATDIHVDQMQGKIYMTGAFIQDLSSWHYGGFTIRMNPDMSTSIPWEDRTDIILKAYPNPVAEILTIENSSRSLMADIQLVDDMGRTVMSTAATGSTDSQIQLNLAHLPPGIYYLSVIDHIGFKTIPIIKL